MSSAIETPGIPARKGLRGRLWDLRASSRMAYLLHLGTRVGSSLLALIWSRLLVGALGLPLQGNFMAFQNFVSLGGVGDLGLGGAVGLKTSQSLGQGREEELRRFLAVARTVFLLLAVLVGGGTLLLSPLLPGWLKFKEVEGNGSFTLLFAVGALMISGVMFSSYINNLNYGCGNVAWPVLPAFLLGQSALLCHWLLARQHLPLWIQAIPYLANAALAFCLMRFYIRASHPSLAALRSLAFDRRLVASLFEQSFWVYLCGLGNTIYRSTDALVINAGFAPDTLPVYVFNYKFCELALFVVVTASFVSLPKITQWMASTHPADLERVRIEMKRLNQFQAFLSCAAALAYLGGNDLFMKLWWYRNAVTVPPAPLAWQAAFALNLAITGCSDAGLQIALRSGNQGLRYGGIAVGLAGLLNLTLSIVSMKLGSIAGIAVATVLAQALLGLAVNWRACHHLGVSSRAWGLKFWLLPMLTVGLGAALRRRLTPDSVVHVLTLAAVFGAMLLAAAWLMGIRPALIREEWKVVRSALRGKGS